MAKTQDQLDDAVNRASDKVNDDASAYNQGVFDALTWAADDGNDQDPTQD